MFVRILTASIAALALSAAAAVAQTGTGPTTGPTMNTSPSPSTSPSGGGAGSGGNYGQMAQQPGGFNPNNYKTQSDCLNAAMAAHASTALCKSIRTK